MYSLAMISMVVAQSTVQPPTNVVAPDPVFIEKIPAMTEFIRPTLPPTRRPRSNPQQRPATPREVPTETPTTAPSPSPSLRIQAESTDELPVSNTSPTVEVDETGASETSEASASGSSTSLVLIVGMCVGTLCLVIVVALVKGRAPRAEPTADDFYFETPPTTIPRVPSRKNVVLFKPSS